MYNSSSKPNGSCAVSLGLLLNRARFLSLIDILKRNLKCLLEKLVGIEANIANLTSFKFIKNIILDKNLLALSNLWRKVRLAV